MKLSAKAGSLQAIVRREIADTHKAVERGVRGQARKLKETWRAQVAQALGRRLANSIRQNDYEAGMKAASLVFPRDKRILHGHENAGVTRAKRGKYLVIPLPGARRIGGRRPQLKDHLGQKGVRMIPRPGGRFLVVRETRSRAVFLFLLVRQTKRTKRLDLMGAGRQAIQSLPAAILNAYEEK